MIFCNANFDHFDPSPQIVTILFNFKDCVPELKSVNYTKECDVIY